MDDEFARDLGPTNNTHSGSTSLVLTCNSTPGPALNSVLIPVLVFDPPSISDFSNKLFR